MQDIGKNSQDNINCDRLGRTKQYIKSFSTISCNTRTLSSVKQIALGQYKSERLKSSRHHKYLMTVLTTIYANDLFIFERKDVNTGNVVSHIDQE